METENGQVDREYDMIFMLGGLWEVCPFFVIGGAIIMKQDKQPNFNKKASPKKKEPPIKKDPKVFEKAFLERLDRYPTDFVMDKIQSGSDIGSVRYLYEILSAEIARKNNCICVDFDIYYAKALNEVKRMEQQKKIKKYNKLVRDRIPEIIQASGKSCKTDVLTHDAYIQKLDEKLNEELAEYQKSKSLEELADLLEVMGAVVRARGYTWEELTQLRKAKRAERGAFDQKILLVEVIE